MRERTVLSLVSVVAVGAAVSSSGSGEDFSPEFSRETSYLPALRASWYYVLEFSAGSFPAVRAVTQPQDCSLRTVQPQHSLTSNAFSVTVKQWGVALTGRENRRVGT